MTKKRVDESTRTKKYMYRCLATANDADSCVYVSAPAQLVPTRSWGNICNEEIRAFERNIEENKRAIHLNRHEEGGKGGREKKLSKTSIPLP